MAHLGFGIPGYKMFYILAAISVVSAFTRHFLLRKRINRQPFPRLIKAAIIFNSICFLITNHQAYEPRLPLVLANIATFFIFPIALWYTFDNEHSIKLYIKYMTIMSVIALIGVIPEIILQHNYILDLEQSLLSIEDFVIDASTIRFGLKRTNSIFSYFTTFGVFSLFSFFLYFCLKYIYKVDFAYRIKTSHLLLAMFLCALTTGSRAIILAAFIFMICCWRSKYFSARQDKMKLYIWIFFLLPIILPVFLQMADSIINSNTTEYAGGSSAIMRQSQLDICLPYFFQSPIWGNGRMYLWDYVKPLHWDLLGAESVWFQLLVDYGLMGCISYLFVIAACTITLYRKRKIFAVLPIAYLAVTSFSPEQGIQLNVLLCLTVFLIRLNSSQLLTNCRQTLSRRKMF